MRVLIDTSLFIWLLRNEPGKVGSKSRNQLLKADPTYLSAASVFEMNLKVMAGKLRIPEPMLSSSKSMGLQLLDMSASHAEAIFDFPQLARHDPFDRMLLAQAKTENLQFFTADQLLLDLCLPFVHDCRK